MARRSSKNAARENKHAAAKRYIELGKLDIPTIIEKAKNPFFLVLDGIQDPHNLGACLRTADAAGVHAVIAPRKHAVGITDTVARISCGAQVPFIRVTNLTQALKELQKHDVMVVGTADGAKSTSLFNVDFSGPVALVLGAEGNGIRRLTQNTCDHVVSLPMSGAVECLNISVAAGICLYEVVRQRIAAK
ncbi:MAG: 23S rRNA (guanosine(2251)-2'-O)-methyltransferase RlmB [Planctomycetota bacterium]|nr:23S rRNA (guanosine(2251)-2'-O)-methyltransferase RlmB [Planctomycetota bacterium]